ncbi:MAG: DUF5666 domain-containing protein [Sinimarinibacterium sp.]|jgi:hypothetical protein
MTKKITGTAFLVALSISACGGGGGGGSAEAPTGKSAIGIVGGQSDAPTFGGKALVVQGTVTQNGKPAASGDVQPGDLITADVVSTSAKADGTITVKDVDIRVEVKGVLTGVDVSTGTLQLLSQVVVTDALTVIVEENADDTYSSLTLADLAAGDYVEVSGERQVDGSLLATRIERKRVDASDDDYDEAELRGTVSALDATAMTFQIGDQLVDYSTALIEGTLAEGVEVEVEGQLDGNTLTATKVEIDDDVEGEPDGEGELEGQVTALDSAAQTFSLLGYTIDFSAASVEGNLVEGARVEVEGQFDDADASLFHAEKVEVKHEDGGLGSADGEVKGAISNLDSTAGTFSVGENSFYVTESTVIESDDHAATLQDIQDGDFVEVKFDSTQQVDGRMLAIKIELEDEDSDDGDGDGDEQAPTEVKGLIADFDAANKTFSVNGYSVTVSASTTYESGDESIDEAAFFSIDRSDSECEVKGTIEGTSMIALRIELESEGD